MNDNAEQLNDAERSGEQVTLRDKENLAHAVKHDKQREFGALSRFLLRIADEIEAADREQRLEMFRRQIKAHKYFDGHFFGYVDENCEFIPADRDEGTTWYQDNQIYPYLRTALMELSRTRTDIIVNPAQKSETMEAVAKFAKDRVDANRDRTFTSHLKQTENTYALLNGIVFRYTFFPFERGGRSEKIPVVTDRRADSYTKTKICLNCMQPQTPTDANDPLLMELVGEANQTETDEVCPNCGANQFDEMESPDSPEVVIDYEDIPQGENKWVSPNPVSVIVSMQASTIEETPFLKWKQLIIRSVLEEKFNRDDLPSTGTESLELRYITNQKIFDPRMENEFGASLEATNQTGRELEILEFQQVWLDYPVYCKATFAQDTPLSNGMTLKAGQKLGTLFPDGLYFAKVGNLIVDVWNESKNDKWVSSPYSLRAGSMYGHGTQPAMADQELINDLTRLKMANAWSNGVPREFVDPDIIPELSADPTTPTVVQGSTNPIIGYAYATAPPLPLSAEVYEMTNAATSAMQNKIGAMSTGQGGLSDSQEWGNTATAIQVKRDLAVGRFAPDLELMADNLDRKQAYQFLINEQQYFTPQQWEIYKGEYGEDALRQFLQADIRRDLTITIAPGSYMPKSDAQMQAKFMAFAQMLPVLMQVGNPEYIAFAAELYGMPESLGGWSADRQIVAKVIERYSALAEMFVEQFGDIPSTDLQDPQISQACELIYTTTAMPIDAYLDNHDALIDAIRDWRQTDEGRGAKTILLAALAHRILKHEGAKVARLQLTQALMQEASAPSEQAAQAEAEAMEQKQLAAAEEEGDAQTVEKVAEYADRDEQRAHQKELKQMEIDSRKEKEAENVEADESF